MWMLVVVLFFFASCSSIKHIPFKEVESIIEYHDSVRYDSIHISDSVYIRDGRDTVYISKIRKEYRYLFCNKTDTVVITDTLSYPVQVDRELSRWEQTKMDFGGMAIGAVAVILPALLIYIARRFRRV